MLVSVEMLASGRRLPSEQLSTVVICRRILAAAEFNAAQKTLTCLGMLKGTSGSERGRPDGLHGYVFGVFLCTHVCLHVKQTVCNSWPGEMSVTALGV